MRPFLDGTLAKMIAKTLCQLTRTEGAGMVAADGGDVRLLAESMGLKVVNLTPEGRLKTIDGPLTSKAITRFLWENRGWRALARPNLVCGVSYRKTIPTWA